MPVIVQKFGGTSVGDVSRIQNAARRIAQTQRAGNDVAVVVSAMAGETDALVELAAAAGGANPAAREADVLLATGEQKSSALLAMALQQLGCKARSFTGAQIGMRSDAAHGRARILHIKTAGIRAALARGEVAVLAGFQAQDSAGNTTTLGRGGSDTSAVAIAAALQARTCEIYTDVQGVFTADPRMVQAARKLRRVSYGEMIELASLGSKVLQIRSVKFAMRYRVPLHVRSSFNQGEGTWVVDENEVMERLVVSGVTYRADEAKIRVCGVKDTPGVAGKLFGALAAAGIVVDVIVQNVSHDATTDMTFTAPRADFKRAMQIALEAAPQLGGAHVEGDDKIAKVSVVGLGMKDHAGVAAKMFRVLAGEGINIQMIGTSEIKISVIVDEKYTELAVRALHEAFVGDGAAAPRAEN